MKKTIQELLAESIKAEVLTPELTAEISTLFEAKVAEIANAKIAEEKKMMDEANKKALNEFKESLITKIDEYLKFAVEEFIKDNKIEIEKAIMSEQAKDFFSKIKNLFVEAKVEIPETEKNLVANKDKYISTLKTEMNELYEENKKLNKQIFEYQKAQIFTSLTEKCTESQKEYAMELIEGMEFASSKEFSEKLKIVIDKLVVTEEKPLTGDKKKHDEDPAPKEDESGVNKYLKHLV